MKKKRITTRVCFFQQTANDVSECVQHFDIIVPKDVDENFIREKLRETHRRLTEDDLGEKYKKYGLNPRFLLETVCEENGWELDDIDYGVNMSFDVSDTSKYLEAEPE